MNYGKKSNVLKVWFYIVVLWYGLGLGLGYGLGYGLGLGLSGRRGNSDREPLGSGNSDQKPRSCQHCYYQHLWVVIPKVGNSDDW